MYFLNWYWTAFAAHADALTWLGVALVASGLYLSFKQPKARRTRPAPSRGSSMR